MRVNNLLRIMSLCLMLSGCTSSIGQRNFTSTPPSSIEGATESETNVATLPAASPVSLTVVMVTSTMTPLPPLPEWASEDIAFGKSSIDCILPCWLGLRVNQSTAVDAQVVLNEQFGFSKQSEVISQNPERDNLDLVGSAYDRVFSWPLEHPHEYINLDLWFERNTHTLKGMFFNSNHRSANQLDSHMSPKYLVQHFGKPSSILASISITESAQQVVVNWLMAYYEQGMVFRSTVFTPLVKENNVATVVLCFDDKTWDGSMNARTRDIFVLEPLKEGFDNLTPLQNWVISNAIEEAGLKSSKDAFGLTTEQISQILLEPTSPCIKTPLFKK